MTDTQALAGGNRSKQVDILLGVGIVFVVMGHSYQPGFLFYPAYAFHMALFFFISGFLFTPKVNLPERIRFLIKKTKSQLFPYYLCLIGFGLLTAFLRKCGIHQGLELGMDSLVWSPLGRGDGFPLYLSAWFLLALYCVNVVAAFSYSTSRLVNLVSTSLFFLGTFWLIKNNFADRWIAGPHLVRTVFGLAYFGFGILFRSQEKWIRSWLLRPRWLFLIIAVLDVLIYHYRNITYSIVFGNVGNEKIWVPILSTTLILLLLYAVSDLLARWLSDSSLLVKLGRRSFWVMVFHFLAFFAVNLIFYAFGKIEKDSLDQVYFKFDLPHFWPVYLSAGLMLPLGLALLSDYFKERLRKRFLILSSTLLRIG